MPSVKEWLPDFLPRHLARFKWTVPPWPDDLASEDGVLLIQRFYRALRSINATYAEADAASGRLEKASPPLRYQEQHCARLTEEITAARLDQKPAAGHKSATSRLAAEVRYRLCPGCNGTGLAWIDAPDPPGYWDLETAERLIPYQARRRVFSCSCPAGDLLRAAWSKQPIDCPYPDLNRVPELDPRKCREPEPEPTAAQMAQWETTRARLRVVGALPSRREAPY